MRKTAIYARRLIGDIGPLGYDPATSLPGRIFAPAVAITGYDQPYDEESVTQHFEIGSRMVVDERTFHYSQAVAAILYPNTYRLSVSTDQILAVNDLISTTATTVAGRTVTLTVGAFQGGAVPLNDLRNGYVECNAAGIYAWRRIVSNTAVVGGLITITVDRPFGQIFAIGSQFSIHKSLYKNVADTATAALVGFAPVIGLAPIPVQIAYFFWLQTYGPCFIGPTGAWPLSVANQYDVYYHQDGTTNSSLAEGVAIAASPQRIGRVMGSGNYGSGAVFLELAA